MKDTTPKQNRQLIGRPVLRVEDLRLVRGHGEYVDDVWHDGMLHALIVRSSRAHGRIRSIDTSAARAMSGVRGAFTAQDIMAARGGAVPKIPMRRGKLEGLEPFEQPVIAVDKVRYVGEPVAIIVADTMALAEDAAETVVVDIDPLIAVADCDMAESGTSILFEEHGKNLAVTYVAQKGDVTAVNAPYRRREKLSVHRHTAVSIEPRGLVANWSLGGGNKLTVIGAAKAPFATRRVLAKCLAVPEESIDMLECDIGGGFGVRGDFFPEDYLVPFAAHQVGRPVKWVESRRENLLASSHAREADAEIEIACGTDGTVLALAGRIRVDMGCYIRNAAEVPPRNAALFITGPYRIPNSRFEAAMVLTNKAPVGTYRAPGRFEADFFRERMFDMAARDLGIDPVEFRRRNLVTAAEMPYAIASITPSYGESQVEFDGGSYTIALDRCLDEIGWKEKSASRGKLIGDRYHGLGVGCFIEAGGAGPREHARIALETDGTVSVFVGSSNIGQGLETVCTQIAGDALNCSMDAIKVFHGSTTYLKDGVGSFASRSVVMGGSAILDAAEKLKAELRLAAARHFNCDPSAIVIGDELSVSDGKATLPFMAVIGQGLSAEGLFASTKRTYAYGAAAAHVAVDPGSGQVEIIEYVTVQDVGRIINPLTANGQSIGGVVQGLGGTMFEHLQYDEEGQLLSGSLSDYAMPLASDFSNIKAVELELSPAPSNPLGAKGGGEGGMIPVGGVVANAIASALAPLGVEPRHLPLTTDRIWKLIRAREKLTAPER